ncbi:unnamed protein product [Urochloa humidicola]
MAKEVRGVDFDPHTEPLDAEVVVRVGGGRQHGRLWIADSAIDSAPTLSQVRARQTDSSPPIRQRPNTVQLQMEAFQAQLQAQVQAQMQAERERLEQENARRWEAYAQYMQTLGFPQPPFSPFAPRAGTPTPNQSAVSNEGPPPPARTADE